MYTEQECLESEAVVDWLQSKNMTSPPRGSIYQQEGMVRV